MTVSMLRGAARTIVAVAAVGLRVSTVLAQAPLPDSVWRSDHAIPTVVPIDLVRQPTLYVVPYTHLDTEWNWDYVATIDDYLPETMRRNFAYFGRYPHYRFNFTGANRYRLMREYYPTDFAQLARWVAAGRWFPAGSSIEEGDVNAPNAESIFRQILYGNAWFRHAFGVTSDEYMLPDCFGFPSSLPSILAHAGMLGFSTQKLSPHWQPAARVGGPGSPEATPEGIPFNVGRWIGPDGQSVIAALNPGSYDSSVDYDLSSGIPQPLAPVLDDTLVDWPARIAMNGRASGLFADYHYIGQGDVGGAPPESSVRMLEAMATGAYVPVSGFAKAIDSSTQRVAVGTGPVHVVQGPADRMFHDIVRSGATDRLPTYTGELELINHSAGSLTSQAMMKRWNRESEVLADAAERGSVISAWLGGRSYPRERLNDAWMLTLAGQFHDIMAGTAMPKAYEYSWNDAVIAMNQFAGVITSATDAVASVLDTRAIGTPIVVYNALNVSRQDVVEAVLPIHAAQPAGVRVVGPDGREVPAQRAGDTVLFVASVPSVGYAVYDVQAAPARAERSALSVTDSSLDNARYRVRLNRDGDVASIFDKRLGKELLSAPLRLAFQNEHPQRWPAWNMDWADQQKAPRAYVGGAARVRIVEQGPARVALSVTRATDSSTFTQIIRLSAGDAGDRVEFGNVIDWRSREAALKASISTTASNSIATYNWDVGTIQRGNNNERQYEVGSHQWFDVTDTSRTFGVTVLTDAKNGSDKPNDSTVRLTLLYTPGVPIHKPGTPWTYFEHYAFMGTNDWGHHAFTFGLAGHAGDWRSAGTDWQGYRLNQPLMAVVSPAHPGALGKRFSFLQSSSSRVRVLAVKRAEQGDAIIVRAVELDGRAEPGVRFTFGGAVTSVQDVDAQERPLRTDVHPATLVGGAVIADFTPFQPRTFAVRLAPARVTAPALVSHPIPLAYDRSVSTHDGEQGTGGFDGQGNALPAELLPSQLDFAGVHFQLGSHASDAFDALTAKGQTLTLPRGTTRRVYVLAAAADSDRRVTFRVGRTEVPVTVQRWTGYVGSWDNRLWARTTFTLPPESLPKTFVPGSAEAMQFEQRQREHPPTRDVEYGQLTGIAPGFIKRADIAWYASHHHTANGMNATYAYSYLFAYAIDVPAGARTLTLPNDPYIRVMAVTAVDGPGSVRPAGALYDTLDRALGAW